MASLARLHPTWDRLVLLVDKREGRFDPAEEPFGTVEIEDLAVKSKYRLLFQYTLLEMSTAAKPWLLSHLSMKATTASSISILTFWCVRRLMRWNRPGRGARWQS